MFWGLIMEPNKRYTQVVEKPFHISQAAMDTSTGDADPCQVMVVVDGKNFLICTLQKNKTVQVPLDMYFKTGDAVSFLINGKCNVHLTGYLDPEFDDTVSEDDEEEEQDEAPITNKRKLLDAPENSVNKKAKHDKKTNKKAVAAESSDDDDDDDEGDNTLRKILDGEDIDTDENDESFQMNSSAYSSSDDDEDDDGDEDDEEKEDKDEDDDEKDEEEADTTLDTSKEEKLDMSKLSKSQKRRLKKKLQQQSKQQQPQVNGVDKSSPAKKDKQDKKAEKKKPEAKNGTQEGQATEKKDKKALNGGVMIEDTKVGNGPVAKPGKVVMVYYEGRLKENKKMFDNCMKGPGFKFRLGAKEVISGWDVGIVGMKVGGKRRIICPPAMAYGAKGSPPAIPPNSTLVFEVELKNIK